MMKMKRTIETAAILVLLSLLTAEKATSAFHHVIVGRGALEVQLIAAKLADRSGDTCAIITSSDENYIRMMLIMMMMMMMTIRQEQKDQYLFRTVSP
jgi:hypothetical protein